MRIRHVETCPACGSTDREHAVRLDSSRRERFLELSERKYGGVMNGWLAELDVVICRCGTCGHHWYGQQPDEEELGRMYDAGRPLAPVTLEMSDCSPRMLAEMRRLRRLVHGRGRSSSPSLLDYGSGFGRWAQAAAKAGFETTAYEPSAVRSERAIPSVRTLTRDKELGGRIFDAINVEQVLEHAAAPDQLLRKLYNLCHRFTIVRLTVPNMERAAKGGAIWIDWPFNGRRMHIMAPFEHLHGFTPRSLLALAVRTGFGPIPLREIWPADPMYCVRRFGGRMFPLLEPTKLLVAPLKVE